MEPFGPDTGRMGAVRGPGLLKRPGVGARTSQKQWLGLVGLAVLVSCVLGAAVSFTHLGSSGSGALSAALNISLALAAGLFLTGGVLRLCRWRVARDLPDLWRGASLALMGAVCLPLSGLGQLLGSSNATELGATARGIAGIACMVLLAHALQPDARPSEQQVGELRLTMTALTATAVLVLVLHAVVPVEFNSPLVAETVVSLTLATGWAAVAWLARAGAVPASTRAIAPMLAGLGVAELLRLFDAAAPGGWTLASVLLSALVAGMAANAASNDLAAAVRRKDDLFATVARDLDRARDEVGRARARQEEMQHDARNACAGLRGALVTLDRYDGRLPADDSATLRRAALSEIARIEALIAPVPGEPLQVFDVAAVAAASVQMQRALGHPVRLETDRPLMASGVPHAFASALQNLLVNSSVHAAGAPTTVRVTSTGSEVVVVVEDEGPGIDTADRGAVFTRGHRRPDGPGSGLGLHNATAAMRAQGGELRLLPRARGCAFRLSLTAAPGPVLAVAGPALRLERCS